tara:strand:- start:4058 stop:4513 length:456 start_codon:yes stop_codon:yes gene_type:complete
MAKQYITYKDHETKSFIAPDPGAGKEPDDKSSPGAQISFIHLGYNPTEGLHFGIVMDGYKIPEQDKDIDMQVVDLSKDAKMKALFEASPGNNRHAMERALLYPDVTDQLDSILKYFKDKKAGGEKLPADLDNLVTEWDAVKTKIPKEGLVE